MRVSEPLIAVFEEAVEPEIKRLQTIASEIGDMAMAMREKDPDIDLRKTSHGKLVHDINNVLQFMAFTSTGEFKLVSENLANSIKRIIELEDETRLKDRPSEIIQTIKMRVDETIGFNSAP